MMRTVATALLGCAATLVAAQPACNSPDPSYDMMATFPSPNVAMYYTVDTEANVIRIKADWLGGNGYLSVAFSRDGEMENSAAIIAQPGANSVGEFWCVPFVRVRGCLWMGGWVGECICARASACLCVCMYLCRMCAYV